MDLSGNVSVQTSMLNPCFNNNVQRDSASPAQVGHCLKVKYDSLQIVSVTWDFLPGYSWQCVMPQHH